MTKTSYKARGYYAVATAPTKQDSYSLYVEYMERAGFPPKSEREFSEWNDEAKIAMLEHMISAPYSKGGKTTATKFDADTRRQWQSMGGKLSKRGPAKKENISF